MDNSANSDANITEDERSSGKRKLDEANGGEDVSNEEGFSNGRVTRMRVSETTDKNGGASGVVNAADLSELTTDSKATPNHQKHGTPSSALPPNGPAHEDLGNGPLNPSLGENPHATGPGHLGPPEPPSHFEATPGSLSLLSSIEAAHASFSFPSLSDAPHASTALSVDGASLSEGVLPPSDLMGDRPSHTQPSNLVLLPLQSAFNFDRDAQSDDQQLEAAVVQELSRVSANETSQDGAVLAWDTSVALGGLGLEQSGAQTATTDGETPSDQEMGDAFAGSENVSDGALEERAVQERASEPELQGLELTAVAVLSVVSATPALEAKQSDEEPGATLDAMGVDLSGHPCVVFEDDVMGGELNGDDEVGRTGDEANVGSSRGDDVSMGEVACDEVRGENMESDDVSGGDGDVSERAGEQYGCAELASGAAQLQLLVKLFDGRMVLVRADPSEGAEAMLEKIRVKTGVDCVGQRLLYNGRELPPDAPLAAFSLESGCTLTLAARLRSSAVPWAFTLTERLLHYAKVALDPGEKLGRREVAANTVTHQVAGLLENARHLRAKAADSEWGAAKAGVVDVFRTMGGPRMLHALLQSPDDFCRRCAEDCIHGFVTEVQTDYLFTRGRLGLYCLPVLTDVWTALLADDLDHVRETYEEVTSALLATLAGKSQWLLRDYFRLSKQGALDFFVGMLERVKDRLCALTNTLTDVYTEEGHSYHAWLQPLPEAKTFGVLCHVVVSAMQSAADEIIHWFDVAEIAPGGERQYTRAAWEGGGVWSRLGEAYARVQRVLDPGFYADVAAWWGATSAALWEGVLTDDPQSTREQVFLARVTLDDSARSQVNGVLGERIYHVLDGLAAFNFGGPQSPFFERFEALLTGHESEIDAIALACPENKAWMFDAPARRHLASRTRVAWFLKQFPEPEEGGPRVEIIVSRGPTLLPETLSMIGDEETNDLSKLQRGLGVVFDGEEAEGPGVLREWFALVARELFSEEKGLFLAAPEDKRRVFPNPASGEAFGRGRCKKHLEYMRLAGHVLGLAILHRVPLGVLLSTAFYKALARQPLSWVDARDISPDLYNSCKAVMELPPADVEALGLTFSADVIQNGAISTVDLVAGGDEIAVTGDNRANYIDRLVNYRLLTQAEPQLGAFHQGLSVIITGTQSLERALTIVGQQELEEILESSSPEIDVRDWILHTEYSGYTPECDQVRWFWRVVEEMTSEQRRRLLYFATAVAHLPLSGFSGLPHAFRLHRAYVDLDWLPTAHTCFHLFMLPPYSSYEMMRSRLLMVTQDHVVEGFGFV